MGTSGPVFVVDYVDLSFEDVCDLLEQRAGSLLTTRARPRPIARVGGFERVADHVGRVPMFDPQSDSPSIAELRVIAVSTGRDPLTEVLVLAPPPTDTAAGHAVALLRARSILQGALGALEVAARRSPRAWAS